jgi:signal transduction histidine kinase
VRAQDSFGKLSSETATVTFIVLSVPLQNRAWFAPLVAVVIVVPLFLIGVIIRHSRKIALANTALHLEMTARQRTAAELALVRDRLEERVVERTTELSAVNDSLRQAMAERLHAEQAQRQLEVQLREAQKMQAIGTLAGGIAHDFNNILTVILPSARMALADSTGNPKVQEDLEQVIQAAERARSLVKQILAFSRHETIERQVVNLAALVQETNKMLRAALPTTTELVLSLEPNLPAVLADPNQVHQVLMNLCTNAQQALRSRPSRIELGLCAMNLNADEVSSLPGLLPGPPARLTVQDNGMGMSEEVKRQIFDPFFTTKAPGEGTGLGLALVHGIVKGHEGAIRVHSRVGEGTRFEIFLPALSREAQPSPPHKPESITVSPGARILLVDDDVPVAQILVKVLSKAGYQLTVHHRPQRPRRIRQKSRRFRSFDIRSHHAHDDGF